MGRTGVVALLMGAAALAVGIGVAVVRHDRDEAARIDAERARYEAVLREVAAAPPRFSVSYVEIPIGLVPRYSRGRTQMVRTEVGRRLLTRRPPLRPDFAALAGDRTDPSARVFKEGMVTERRVSIVGLLVTQTTPGPGRLRLEVDRVAIEGFVGVWDALDLLPQRRNSLFRDRTVGPIRREVVAWQPRYDRTAFIPVAFLHLFRIPPVPVNAEIIEALGGLQGEQVTSHVVLGPRRLLLRSPNGRDLAIPIRHALHPLVLTPRSEP